MNDELRNSIESIADQLCRTVDGDFNFRVRHESIDPTIEKLLMLINFMLDSMDRSVQDLNKKSEQLQRQVEIAEAAGQAKADFLANMSHEIRTPLNGIIGLTSLLQQTRVNDEQADLVNGVRISSDNLLAIINDILDFSKIEAGKLDLEGVAFDLHSLVQEVAESQAARAAQKQLELVVRFVPNTPNLVKADEARLRQVLINLVGNALKFTDSGHVMISVNYDKDRFQFQVEDTGIGIPIDRRDTLFEEFTQADTSTTRRYGGTGLGLAISKRIINAMGGDIRVSSRTGGGSVFSFHLPMEILSNQSIEPLPKRPLNHSDLRVLIVDDNQINRFVLQEQLLHWRISSETAQSAQEGLQLLETAYHNDTPYDIAILDYAMPDEDGVSLAKKIKTGYCSDTRLVLLSSLGNTLQNQELIDIGFSGALLKPAPWNILRELLMVLCADLDGEKVPALLTRQSLTSKANHSAAKEEPFPSLRILVAEDNVVNQKVASALLERMGCHVYVANNGIEALDLLQRFTVDLIFMDMQMPEMNGIEATRELRNSKHDHFRKVPIIALTANATAKDKAICFEAGMNDFLPKPFKPEALREMLSTWGSAAKKT